jgi:hypothetical protein
MSTEIDELLTQLENQTSILENIEGMMQDIHDHLVDKYTDTPQVINEPPDSELIK